MQDIISLTGVPVGKGVNNRKFSCMEYAGPCPLPGCNCTDSFHLYPDLNDIPGIGTLGLFICMGRMHGGRGGCDQSGDALDFLELKYGLSFEDACIELGIDPLELINYRREHRGQEPTTSLHKRNQRTKALAEESATWRTTALAFAQKASANLAGESLDYLLSRDFPVSTIKNNLLGFYPEYRFVKASLWGGDADKKILLPRGIVIPWFNAKNEIICLRVRRLPGDESEEAKKYYGDAPYRVIAGSASAFLYHAEFIAPGCNVAMFEGELDALAAGLNTGLDIVCVATGSTSWGRSEETKRLLSQAEQVLICFDNDANLAGERASEYWLEEMSHARRWRPIWEDANDMLRDGVDLAEWLALGFLLPTATPEEVISGEPTDEELLRELEQIAADLPPLCCRCLDDDVEMVAIGEGPDGAFCVKHRPGQRIDPLHDPVYLAILSNPMIPQPAHVEVIPHEELAAFKLRILDETRGKMRDKRTEVQDMLSILSEQTQKVSRKSKKKVR